jgi:hypothetical protein
MNRSQNCVVYWYDSYGKQTFTNYRFRETLVGCIAKEGGSPSESLWLYPLWEYFQNAS